jgi:hypothetical protein
MWIPEGMAPHRRAEFAGSLAERPRAVNAFGHYFSDFFQ